MNDLISRQAAIDALKEKVFSNLTDEFYGAMQVLDELPSAQPETNCSEIPNNSDTISRQQAIEVLRNRWLKTRNYEGIGEDIAEECEIYLKTLPSAQPEQRWIPVEERLPEPWDLVLVTDRCKGVRVCQMHHNSSDGWYDECDNWMYFSTSVIAWMPLPEYYQKKDGEQDG